MGKKSSLKKNYIYNLIYQILLIILPIVTVPYVSRILSPDGIGQNSFCSSLITYFTMFASLGFGVYGQREISKQQEDIGERTKCFYEIVICRLVPTVLSLLVHFIFIQTGVYGAYTTLMKVFTINIVSVAIDISFFFQGVEDFKSLTLKNLLVKILGVASIFIFVKTADDLSIYAFINVLVGIISSAFMWTSLRGRLSKCGVKDLNPIRHLLPSLKLFIPTIATSIYLVLDKSLIGLITKSNVENGYYEQAEKIAKMALTIITCYGTIMTPRNSFEFKNGGADKVKLNVYKAMHYVWVVGLPMLLGICLVADNFVPWFLGADFVPAARLLCIFSLLLVIIGFSNVLGLQYLIPAGKDFQYTVSLICGAISNFVLNIIFINLWGALGACMATIIAELVVSLTMYIFVRKELSLKELFKTALKPMLAGIVMVLLVLPLSLNLAPSIISTTVIVVAGVLVYGVTILLLRDRFVRGILDTTRAKLTKPTDNAD